MEQKKRKKKAALSLLEYTRRRVQLKRQLKKEGTAELYQVAVDHFLKFTNEPEFCLQDLSRTLVADFITYLQNKKLATNTSNTYLSSLRAIYNAAVKENLLRSVQQYPFQNLKLRRETTAKRAVPAIVFREMARMETTADPQLELSLDLSLFSFMACGMPFVDIVYLTQRNISGNELVYYRQKTGIRIRLEITTGMWQLIRKYEEAQKERGSPFLFPVLPTSPVSHSQYKRCLALHNTQLKKVGDALRLPDPLTSYVVRHSWASEALRCEVPVAVISQALGHTSEKTTRCYLSELDISQLSFENQKVVGIVNKIVEDRWRSVTYL